MLIILFNRKVYYNLIIRKVYWTQEPDDVLLSGADHQICHDNIYIYIFMLILLMNKWPTVRFTVGISFTLNLPNLKYQRSYFFIRHKKLPILTLDLWCLMFTTVKKKLQTKTRFYQYKAFFSIENFNLYIILIIFLKNRLFCSFKE